MYEASTCVYRFIFYLFIHLFDIHLKSLTVFVHILYVFLIVSPFLETSELQRNMQELERNLSALIDYSVGVILNHWQWSVKSKSALM